MSVPIVRFIYVTEGWSFCLSKLPTRTQDTDYKTCSLIKLTIFIDQVFIILVI